MGLFDVLLANRNRKNVQVIPDRIWMTAEAKFAGLAKEVDERSKSETVTILLVAHFPNVLSHFDEVAE